MVEKKNNSDDEENGDSEEIIERLDPIKLTESDISNDEIDQLFLDDKVVNDGAIDSLFDKERKTFQDDLKAEVQRALSQPVMSKASLYRMRMKEPSESDLKAEIAKHKSVEEIWEEPIDEVAKSQNRKSGIIMCTLIALFSVAGGWALWKSTHAERGNEDDLLAQEKKVELREQEKRLLGNELNEITDVMNRYLSAITVAQKCENIYKADTISDQIKEYYSKNGGVKVLWGYRIGTIIPISLDGVEVWEVFVRKNDELEERYSSYFVRMDEEGKYKVSWKAATGFQDEDIRKFIDKRSRKATAFRFEVKPLLSRATYNWGFKDSDFQVVKLLVPESDLVFWGYVRRGSPEQEKLNLFVDLDLDNQVLKQRTKHEFILKVKFLEDSPMENSQYILIEDIVSRKWVNTSE